MQHFEPPHNALSLTAQGTAAPSSVKGETADPVPPDLPPRRWERRQY